MNDYHCRYVKFDNNILPNCLKAYLLGWLENRWVETFPLFLCLKLWHDYSRALAIIHTSYLPHITCNGPDIDLLSRAQYMTEPED